MPNNDNYCVFCEKTDELKEFKAVYICTDCIEAAKELKLSDQTED